MALELDHDRLVEALKEPDFYPHPVAGVEFLQTHISSVFLTGDYAYKLKKRVDFGFLDFTTAELRRKFCEAEVALNRRLAPSVYLRVAAITLEEGRPVLDGDGAPVDYLVVMRQMDGTRLGPEVLARGELTAEMIDDLVDILVPFYRQAATGKGVDCHGTVEAVRFNTDENFAQTADFVGTALSRRRYDEIRAFTDGFYDSHAELFERRIAEGRIRESHGDLHLGNICFEDETQIFDCIEFSERLRCGDVAVDLAFLAMDLDFRGLPDLAQGLIRRFVELSGDTELPELIDFYRCYRAYVRGKIACFTLSAPGLSEAARAEQLDLARRYFALAHRYAGGRPPAMVVLYGLMGTGKTSLGRYLGDRPGWQVVNSDVVRKRLAGLEENTRVWVPYGHGLYSAEMTARTFDEMFRLAGEELRQGARVVLDGSFKRQSDRDRALESPRSSAGGSRRARARWTSRTAGWS